MHYSRRTLLKQSGMLSLGAMIRPTVALANTSKPLFPSGYPDRKEIIRTAVDAAVSAGASYADARLSHVESYTISKIAPGRTEAMAFGVRVLYQGYWGFASSPVWSKEEAARLGRAAVAQAKANVLGRERVTELAPLSDMTSGHWETPIQDDPFKIHDDEMVDFVEGLTSYIGSLKHMGSFQVGFGFHRNNKAFGSSLGQHTTQTLYSSAGIVHFGIEDKTRGVSAGGTVEELSPAGQGFEYFRGRPLRDFIKIAHEEALADLELPVIPSDVGRFNVLIDQSGVANLVSQSIGTAAEVDRVFGFEANAGGTSYINEPETMLGTLKVGSPMLNVSADRSGEGSIGRVKWDDEGVMPTRFDLIKDGVLVNLQTNREGASWIKDYYERTGTALRSYGLASAPSALDVQLIQKADLYLKPSDTNASRDDLRQELGNGVEFRVPSSSFDFQQVTGVTRGRAYEVKNGKRVARFTNSGMLFRTSELWNNIVRLGGANSVRYYGIESQKGQPSQKSTSAVYAPPALYKDMTIIDVTRKS